MMIVLRIKEARDMKNGFTSGMLIGGMIGATMSMIMNHDIDVNKAKKRMMRFGRSMYRKSRHMMSDIAGMMH
jgi:gas vesicle protein